MTTHRSPRRAVRTLHAAVIARWRRLSAHPDAGSSTAEMALLAPLLIMLLLFVVLCGRLAGAQIDVDAAASSGARSGPLARSQGAAVAGAERTARASLNARGVTCQSTDVQVSTGGLRPGGAVTVTISCRVRMSDLVLLKVPGSRVVTSTATSPIDEWIGGAP
ncbi:TadE/TadG family type IV pilus assembly protein [Actinoplanes sp. TFC3]|uniref:TadE/TadG family type IV pilus assembly protein n=1 Tax=Actinoplanes sp. TFC3 TaxID=1710355 RepID=UPI00083068AB|nr:TadE/TadG family type IV pilus assembly protein [Actinoplanes sp. TFC3]